ncbi:hypothetical protein UPYG_G00217290 [Umbra pygmaea]|uniref:Uncharacterized protein n=1 Tax=Umbra pygmaea TaxID=75934 RepID=A0ABD0X541_UMBPY
MLGYECQLTFTYHPEEEDDYRLRFSSDTNSWPVFDPDHEASQRAPELVCRVEATQLKRAAQSILHIQTFMLSKYIACTLQNFPSLWP